MEVTTFGSNFKIKKHKVAAIVHFTVLLIAGMSTVLRPSIESNITLFRVLLPFLFVWLFMVNTKKAIELSGIIILFLVYSLVVSYLSRFQTFSIVFNLYYITVFFFFYYYKEVLKACGVIPIYKFLTVFFKIIIILGLIQFFFGGVYFNTQDRLPAINIFFWNENEYSSVLAIFVPLYYLREKALTKYIWIVLAIFLMAYNDAKLAVFSLIVFFGGVFILKNKLLKIRYLGFALLAIIGVLLLFFLREYSIQGEYTIEYFLSRLGEHVWTGEPLVHIGTFNARSNAVILGIKEFVNSYFLGIGPGNSLPMMLEIVVPGTERYTALSMHNFTLQIITEMGIFGLLIITSFVWKIVKAAEQSFYGTNLVIVFFLSCLISITLLSGAWSNYFYLFILFYALDFFKENVQ